MNCNTNKDINKRSTYLSKNSGEVLKILGKLVAALMIIVVFTVGCETELPVTDTEQINIALKDDFYQAVNQDWLNTAVIPDGDVMFNTLAELDHLNNEQIQSILTKLSEQQFQQGTMEQKLADLYKTACDMENRNRLGSTSITKYLDSYQSAETIDQLIAAEIFVSNETGIENIFVFPVYSDPKDASRSVLYVYGPQPYLEKESYEDDATIAAYLEYLTTLLMLTGETFEEARLQAQIMLDFEKELSVRMLDAQQSNDIDLTYHPYTIDQLNNLYHLDFTFLLNSLGYPDVEHVIVSFKELNEYAASCFNEEQLETLKIYGKFSFLLSSVPYLSEDFLRAQSQFYANVYGIQGNYSVEQRATMLTSAFMPDYLGQMYIDQSFSAEAKAEIEQMIDQLIATYKIRLVNTDWLSAATKQKAIAKLDAMSVQVGYPNHWDTTFDDVKISTYKDGGSLLDNIYAIRKVNRIAEQHSLTQPPVKDNWEMVVYEANAYYSPYKNQIVFPAGILQPPLYNREASLEESLGAIGVVIAHEISHAFDNNGSKFDEKGNAANWWTDEDYNRFEEKQRSVAAFYDGVEAEPGILNNGQLTLSENIADLGALACALQLLQTTEHPDYQTFFKSWATTFRTVTTEEYHAYLSKTDVHSLPKVRINRSVVNFQEFHDAFNITENDRMYVAPEDRVSVW